MALSDDDIRRMLASKQGAPPSSQLLGFELLDYSIDDGWAEVAFTGKPEFGNPMGMLQGGFVAAMLDDAMGFTAFLASRFSKVVPTLQMTIMFLKPTPIGRVLARGEVLRLSNATAQLAGTLRLADGTVLATATATAAVRVYPQPRDGVKPARKS